MIKKILITGGAGFIGGNLVERLLKRNNCIIFNVDKISPVSSFNRIERFNKNKNKHFFYKINLENKEDVFAILEKTDPDLIIHLAAESHVDRSLNDPTIFIESNIIGTFNILEASRKHFENLSKERRKNFKFHHVSTDEVFGSLDGEGKFDENTNYSPRSPYSASKASSDHLVEAWFHSFSLPIVITNCSNNYGPYQHPEKLIPLSISRALKGQEIPIYGDGLNIRDWLYIDDHIDALLLVADNGKIGQKYCIGGYGEKTNNQVVLTICELMDNFLPKSYSHKELINFVPDRMGHDRRYAINSEKIFNELGWKPKYEFKKGIELTINWYLKNQAWLEARHTK